MKLADGIRNRVSKFFEIFPDGNVRNFTLKLENGLTSLRQPWEEDLERR